LHIQNIPNMKQLQHLLIIFLFLPSLFLYCDADEQFKLTLLNDLATDVEIKWEGGNDEAHSHGVVSPEQEIHLSTLPGHTFTYVYNNKKYSLTASEDRQHVSLLNILNEEAKVRITYRNELPQDIEMHWEDGHGQAHFQGSIPSTKEATFHTFSGHTFTYEYNGEKYRVTAEKDNHFEVLLGPKTDVTVVCWIGLSQQNTEESILVEVKPAWSPRGAARFLDLVREGYYDNSAMFRVVPRFLTQFGIAADFATRMRWREATILDDSPSGVPFQPGMLSFAGSGPDSRSTEMFVVMPDTPQVQLDNFGTNSWETPFGKVKDVEKSAASRWYSYGDMPPWGEGPDSGKIYEKDGYEYLKRDFPEMDYISNCQVVGEMEAFDTKEL